MNVGASRMLGFTMLVDGVFSDLRCMFWPTRYLRRIDGIVGYEEAPWTAEHSGQKDECRDDHDSCAPEMLGEENI